jgi:hypothetical protein
MMSGLKRISIVAENVNDIIKRLSTARRKKVESRAAQLIAEEMTQRDIRKARKKGVSERPTPELGKIR